MPKLTIIFITVFLFTACGAGSSSPSSTSEPAVATANSLFQKYDLDISSTDLNDLRALANIDGTYSDVNLSATSSISADIFNLGKLNLTGLAYGENLVKARQKSGTYIPSDSNRQLPCTLRYNTYISLYASGEIVFTRKYVGSCPLSSPGSPSITFKYTFEHDGRLTICGYDGNLQRSCMTSR